MLIRIDDYQIIQPQPGVPRYVPAPARPPEARTGGGALSIGAQADLIARKRQRVTIPPSVARAKARQRAADKIQLDAWMENHAKSHKVHGGVHRPRTIPRGRLGVSAGIDTGSSIFRGGRS